MIVLTEVSKKLEAILNDTNNPILGNEDGQINYFKVATEGFHIDSLAMDANSYQGNNFIPVFCSSMGGQFNPVPELKQAIYTIPVTFYYPVRFKDSFYQLGEYLIECFVGQQLTISSTKVLANISVPQCGELQDLDFNEFSQWVLSTYKKKIDVMETYMSMTFNLYLSNCASGFLYGNDVTAKLSTVIDGNTLISGNLVFDDGVIQSASQPSKQQEMADDSYEADGLPFGTNYTSSFKVYVNLSIDNPLIGTNGKSFYKEVLKLWLSGKSQTMRFDLEVTINNDSDLKYTRNCYLESVNLPIQKGQLLTMTFTLSKASQEEQEESE